MPDRLRRQTASIQLNSGIAIDKNVVCHYKIAAAVNENVRVIASPAKHIPVNLRPVTARMAAAEARVGVQRGDDALASLRANVEALEEVQKL